jgi:phage terminase small subunit
VEDGSCFPEPFIFDFWNKLCVLRINLLQFSMNDLRPMQRAFAGEYARNGGNARQAALTAGYSPKTAHSQGSRLLHHPSVQEEIRRQTFAYVDHVAPLAVQALVDVIEDANVRPRDKIKAAEALLDRGFLHRKATAEVTGTVTVEPSKLIGEIWRARQERVEATAQQELSGRALEVSSEEPVVIDLKPVDQPSTD